MRKYIYGCGGVGLEIAELLIIQGEEINGFVVDDQYINSIPKQQLAPDLIVISYSDLLHERRFNEVSVAISLGEPEFREKISIDLNKNDIRLMSVFLGSFKSSITDIGEGTIVHFGSFISNNTIIGRNCLINKRCIVGHDSYIGNNSVLSPNVTIGGKVRIGKNCFIGLGACIRDRIKIGDNSIIGMGAVVTHDVEDGNVVVGNPASVIRKNNTETVFDHHRG